MRDASFLLGLALIWGGTAMVSLAASLIVVGVILAGSAVAGHLRHRGHADDS